MADWNTFEVEAALVGTDFLDKIQDVFDVLIATSNAAVSVLEVLKTFLVSLPNPIEAAVKILVNEIQTVIDNIQTSSVNGLFLIPTSLEELRQYKGGYPKFKQIFLQSLYDIEDPNRPQQGPEAYLGGLFILVQQRSIAEFLRQIIALQYLTQFDTEIRYPAPVGVTIEPADDLGFPADSLISIFDSDRELKTLRLSWEEPKFAQNLFYDIFRDNKFYVERSKSREGQILMRQKTKATLKDPIRKRAEEDNVGLGVDVEPMLNRKGDPISIWEPVDPDNPFVELDENNSDISVNFIAGSYTYILRDVEKGIENGYYYRIRSVPQEVESVPEMMKVSENGRIEMKTVYSLKLNGVTYDESQPSMPVFGHIPDIDTSFDLPTALLNTYRAAYLLRFDARVTATSGETLIGSESLDEVIPEYILEQEPFVVDDEARYLDGALFEEDPDDYESSKRYIASVASVTSSTIFEDDPFSGAREAFDNLFNLTPEEQLRIWIDRRAIKKIEKLVPIIMRNDSLFEMVQSFYNDAESSILGLLGDSNAGTLTSVPLRTAVHLIIELVDRHEQQGIPPNWQSLQPIGDLIPEFDSILDRLFKVLKAYEKVFSDAIAALDATIEGIRARLAILNDIIDVLDQIVAFFESLPVIDFTFGVLLIPPDVGGVSYLAGEFMRAQNVPSSDADDYTAGIALAFGGPGPADVQGTVNAVRFIFGL